MKHDEIVKFYSDPVNIWFIEDKLSNIYTETRLKDVFKVRSNFTPDFIYITEYDEVYIGEVKQNNGMNQMIKAIKQVHRYGQVLRNRGLYSKEFIILKNDVFMFDEDEIYQNIKSDY